MGRHDGTSQTNCAAGHRRQDGTTTTVKINQPNVEVTDKKVLCSAICKCKDTPGIGKDSRSLKQACVSSRLNELDGLLKHRSVYKAELTYDMTKNPPEPILDKEIETKGRDLWPGWTKTLWPKDPTRPKPYQAGKGYTRRPDVVIVNDPTKPATQDNIKQVVEIKFPPDKRDPRQDAAYIQIAGDDTKLVVLGPEDCDCNSQDPQPPKVPVEQVGTAAALAAALYFLLTRRSPPGPVPAF